MPFLLTTEIVLQWHMSIKECCDHCKASRWLWEQGPGKGISRDSCAPPSDCPIITFLLA